MSNKQNWDNTRLADYLLFDLWYPYPAWCVLVGFEYLSTTKNNVPLDKGRFPFFLDCEQAETDANELTIKKMENDIDRLRDFWHNSKFSDDEEGLPPAFYIEWALTKRFSPPWLEWAIEQQLYIPKSEVVCKVHSMAVLPMTPEPIAEESSTGERNSMLKIIAALAVGGFRYPAHGS